MKTITNGTIVKRVDDVTAQENVKKGWQYCPKSSWKVLLRPNTACSGLAETSARIKAGNNFSYMLSQQIKKD
jgi:hypothetical protein